MAHSANIRNHRLDAATTRGSLHCEACGGFREHESRCPLVAELGGIRINMPPTTLDLINRNAGHRTARRIEDRIMTAYYSGDAGADCQTRLRGLPTAGIGMTVNNATGHLQLRPVSRMRCVSDNSQQNLNSVRMCMYTDPSGDLISYDAAFETLQ